MKPKNYLFKALTVAMVIATSSLVTMKLTGVTDLSWWVVLFPLGLYLLLLFVIVTSATLAVAYIIKTMDKMEKD